MTRIEEAGRLFTDRYSCSQAVFAAYAPSFGMSKADALRLSSALGGGLRSGSTCGAALGALLVLGLARCDRDFTPESRHDVMAAVDQFNARFENRTGGLTCPGVLGYDVRDPEQRATVEELGLRESHCHAAVTAAAEILEELLSAQLATG